MKYALLALLALSSAAALAAGTTANISWSPSYVYTDGSTMPVSDIASFTIRWDNGGSLTVNAPVTFPVTVPVPCGDRAFTVQINAKSTAKYTGTSDPSAPPATYSSGVVCKPGPIQAVTAQ